MNKSLSTGSHLNVCSANFSRLKKILNGFKDDRYSFDLLYSEKKNMLDLDKWGKKLSRVILGELSDTTRKYFSK